MNEYPRIQLPTTFPFDTHHWLYKAGYEQGRADERRDRDISPTGKRRPAVRASRRVSGQEEPT